MAWFSYGSDLHGGLKVDVVVNIWTDDEGFWNVISAYRLQVPNVFHSFYTTVHVVEYVIQPVVLCWNWCKLPTFFEKKDLSGSWSHNSWQDSFRSNVIAT